MKMLCVYIYIFIYRHCVHFVRVPKKKKKNRKENTNKTKEKTKKSFQHKYLRIIIILIGFWLYYTRRNSRYFILYYIYTRQWTFVYVPLLIIYFSIILQNGKKRTLKKIGIGKQWQILWQLNMYIELSQNN